MCPERTCKRRDECIRDGGHAVPHDHNKFCDVGCNMHPDNEDRRGAVLHRCVKY